MTTAYLHSLLAFEGFHEATSNREQDRWGCSELVRVFNAANSMQADSMKEVIGAITLGIVASALKSHVRHAL